jgi:hypothetical protein
MTRQQKTDALAILVIMIVTVMLMYVGNAEYEDEKAEEETYCQMVKEGFWPDYNGNYKELCK